MLDFFQLGLSVAFLNLLGFSSSSDPLTPIPLLNWQNTAVFQVPTSGDPHVSGLVDSYLGRLEALGFAASRQRVWLQSDWAELANHQGNVPSAAASLTKVATTLASVSTWDLEHRFTTKVYYQGTLEAGILRGDLLIEGGGDPLFVWEEAIALANHLTSLGISKVTGNLIIVGNFTMNFQEDRLKSGQLLKIALNSRSWTPEVWQQFASLSPSTPKPQLELQGQVLLQESLPASAQVILAHKSLTLLELLKQMNVYSNNFIAESLAQSLGGSDRLVEIVLAVTKIPPNQIQLRNGSGLGVDNRLSAQAVCEMFMTLERQLQAQGHSINDLFPVGERDRLGTMQWRAIPNGVAIKTGTLAQVSALAGIISTQERGLVCFAMINSGSNIEGFRNQQDQLLQALSTHWTLSGLALSPPAQVFLGDPARNLSPN